jgi:2-keto-4-pentenoate hydratase/2-oxohepta-3-ene-1,7-dioic acid hydratase in catechol pathway
MKTGDTLELEITGIGVLRAHVVDAVVDERS